MLSVKVDTHTHTIASIHAYSTLLENINQGKKVGLEGLAVTDHGPALKETFPSSYFGNLRKSIPNRIEGLRIIKGVEANIIDFEGNLDLSVSLFKKLDLVIASCHESVLKPGTIADHNQLWRKVSQNPWVDIIGHPGNGNYLFDFERILPLFKEKKKLVEINSSSFLNRKGAQKNCREIAKLCQLFEIPIVVSSDAHFASAIGDFSEALKMLEEIGFPQRLIANRGLATLMEKLPKMSD
ncbi:phosphatase [uncultured Vagococcus sp.]|uniref:phosphatase n=1 Tax=uncultured Vagococcus sp. TaxID=189676 RepID=UPI0028D87D2B|nr:phosphatase [uncultured Vagococcus sp.]